MLSAESRDVLSAKSEIALLTRLTPEALARLLAVAMATLLLMLAVRRDGRAGLDQAVTPVRVDS